jgi:DNA repair exonuclease SbcCD ATPase subunit
MLSKVGGAAIREELERIDEALAVARTREKDLELDADAWKLLLETLREVENEEGAHLGRALAGPVTTRFAELTSGRYGNLRLDAALKAEAVDVAGGGAQGADVLEALSVGTRNQLATLIRLTIADQLKSAIVLDDHLVNSDPRRLAWFRDVLMKTALNAQIIILTCRPEDYLTRDELPAETATRDLAGGAIRAVDVARVLKRWGAASSRLPMATAVAVGRTDGKLAT